VLKITVLEVAGGKVKLGFEVDSDIPVHRQEIWERMCGKGELNGHGASSEPPHVRSG
jgi:carbon storage regulator CsrA